VSRTIIARWRDWAGEGLEHLVLRAGSDGIRAEAVVIGAADDEIFAVQYRITCDAGWRPPDLAGAIDVDLTATPFTNTLPVRRLELRNGQAEVIAVVYVEIPSLTVVARRQRYTCLEPGRRYRFESLESGFTREIEVDDDGLVRTYPGLFRRVA
jgi:hypothetical protein